MMPRLLSQQEHVMKTTHGKAIEKCDYLKTHLSTVGLTFRSEQEMNQALMVLGYDKAPNKENWDIDDGSCSYPEHCVDPNIHIPADDLPYARSCTEAYQSFVDGFRETEEGFCQTLHDGWKACVYKTGESWYSSLKRDPFDGRLLLFPNSESKEQATQVLWNGLKNGVTDDDESKADDEVPAREPSGTAVTSMPG